MRGRIPLRLALVFAVLGLVAVGIGSVVLARGAYGRVDDFARVRLDGSAHSVRLTRTGDYVGYYEETRLDTSDRFVVMVAITGPGGRLDVRSPTTTLSYDTYAHHGVSAVRFTVPRAGTYTVTGRGPAGARDPQLALGESIASNAVAGVALVIPGVILVLVAIVLLIVGLTRRRKHKREIKESDKHGYSPR